MYRKELFEFCKQKLSKDRIVFDEILDIYDIIKHFLSENKLQLKYEENAFLIKLVHFLNKHSNHAEHYSKKKPIYKYQVDYLK